MSLKGGEHRKSVLNIVFEVALIAIGVFLALWANNWHEDREHRAQARAALRNFAGEMELNRDATQSKLQYHETLQRELHEFLDSKEPATEDRFNQNVRFEGVRPVTFEHTAWDLALATQALSYLEPDLAFNISKVYTQQNAIERLEDSFLTAALSPASLSSEYFRGRIAAINFYLIDVNQKEPAMVSRYEQMIPEVKRAMSGEGR